MGRGHRPAASAAAHRPHRRGAARWRSARTARLLASASDDGTVRLWDAATGRHARRTAHRPHRRGQRGGVQPGRRAAGQRGRRRDGAARRAATGGSAATALACAARVAFTADGSPRPGRAATARFSCGTRHRRARRRTDRPTADSEAVAFSRDGARLAPRAATAGSGCGTQPRGRCSTWWQGTPAASPPWCSARTGSALIAGSHDGYSSKCGMSLPVDSGRPEGHPGEVLGLAFSADGSSVATGTTRQSQGLGRRDGDPVHRLRGHSVAVTRGFSPDGASGSTAEATTACGSGMQAPGPGRSTSPATSSADRTGLQPRRHRARECRPRRDGPAVGTRPPPTRR